MESLLDLAKKGGGKKSVEVYGKNAVVLTMLKKSLCLLRFLVNAARVLFLP
jgi:hypothetical protein